MALRSPSVRVVPAQRMGRVSRYPQHTFQVEHKPWEIQPFLIAPVLPGESMKNLLMQARVISDPIKSRLLGWWAEHFFFYVKHRDLAERDEFVQMMLDPAWTPANVDSATDNAYTYFEGGSGSGTLYIDWAAKCLECVVDNYFRDTDEVAGDHVIRTGRYAAKAFGTTWLQSLQPEAAVTWTDVSISTATDNAFTMRELSEAERQYEWLRQNGAVAMTYEEFLGTYGVQVPAAEELHKPELIRFTRNWAMPVSSIDPTDGSAASAVTWQITERADKDRFFKEPGFIIGVTVVRPKVYRSRQLGHASAMLNNAYAWLPALMSDDPTTSLKLLPDNNGLLGDFTDSGGAWVDVKDLFLYGDQFVNFTLTDTDKGLVALPSTALQTEYTVEADADALFAADTAELIRQDGIVSLNIAGRQVDTSS